MKFVIEGKLFDVEYDKYKVVCELDPELALVGFKRKVVRRKLCKSPESGYFVLEEIEGMYDDLFAATKVVPVTEEQAMKIAEPRVYAATFYDEFPSAKPAAKAETSEEDAGNAAGTADDDDSPF